MAQVKLIDPKEAASWYKNGEAVFVDVRTANEVLALNIPESQYIPTPLVSEKKLQSFAEKNKKIVVYCHSGNRSAKVVNQFGALNGGEVYSLDGGIAAWQKAGLQTETISNVISIERQTHITIGCLMLISLILGINVDSRFLFATGFFGAGMLFAGISGSCLMGIMIGKLPWNRT